MHLATMKVVLRGFACSSDPDLYRVWNGSVFAVLRVCVQCGGDFFQSAVCVIVCGQALILLVSIRGVFVFVILWCASIGGKQYAGQSAFGNAH